MPDYESREFLNKPTRWTEERLRALGKKIVDWAHTTDAYTLDAYARFDKSVSASLLYDLTRRNKGIFKPYIVEARRLLADKMVSQSFEGKASPWVLKTFVTYYNEEIKEHLHDELKVEVEEKESAKERHQTQDVKMPVIVEVRGSMDARKDATDE